MLDSLFQDRTDAILSDRAANPVPQPKPEPGFWQGVLSAAPRGFAIAANETARVAVEAFYGFHDRMNSREQQTAAPDVAANIASRRMAMDADKQFLSASLKSGAEYWKPDPDTVGWAANVVQGFTGFLTKAVGYSLATGNPVAGAALTGADVGGTEYLNLTDQGVDPETAAKVGAVRGVAATAATLLPAVGGTLAKTAGLVAVGGPGGYIAEQSAAKAILEKADYSQLADQIDPFDPVGLAAATLGAGIFGFGLHAVRARGQVKAGPRPTPEQVDAALVVAGEQAKPRLADPADLKATAKEEAAIARAEEQIRMGEPVRVEDVAPDVAAAEQISQMRAAIEKESARLMKVARENPEKYKEAEAAFKDAQGAVDIIKYARPEQQEEFLSYARSAVDKMDGQKQAQGQFSGLEVIQDDGTRLTGDEFMARVEEEARTEAADADLLRVAAECFIEAG